MSIDVKGALATLDRMRESFRLVDGNEHGTVHALLDAKTPFAEHVRAADTLHLHVKVESVVGLPHAEIRAAGGAVENQKDGYVKYAFTHGLNLIFSSITISEDDVRETSLTKRRRPYLDHIGIDLRRTTPEIRALFDSVPGLAAARGWGLASQGGDEKPVFCCHTSVSRKHWLYPNGDGTRAPIAFEFAFGPLVINEGKSGCDLRPSDPRLGLAPACCDAGGSHANAAGETDAFHYRRSDLGEFSQIGANRKDLGDKFFAWYGAVFADGALSAREKSVIALAVAHAVQCPYCIEAYTRDATSKGATLDQLTETVHVAAAIRGGASLVHGIQMRHHAGGH
jgi:alkylhydroperoxidase/carboxymuconolactone decarboxylase family protein